MHWLAPRLAGSSTELGRWPLLAVVIHRFVSLTPPSSPLAFTDPLVGMVPYYGKRECLVRDSDPAIDDVRRGPSGPASGP